MATATVDHVAWRQVGEERFGPSMVGWRFVCHSCGHVQSAQAWWAAGADGDQTRRELGYSCVGSIRDSNTVVQPFEKDKGAGCKYTGDLGGHPVNVTINETPYRATFDFAPESP